jgi:ABC-2 type transport system ATP-binding protein
VDDTGTVEDAVETETPAVVVPSSDVVQTDSAPPSVTDESEAAAPTLAAPRTRAPRKSAALVEALEKLKVAEAALGHAATESDSDATEAVLSDALTADDAAVRDAAVDEVVADSTVVDSAAVDSAVIDVAPVAEAAAAEDATRDQASGAAAAEEASADEALSTRTDEPEIAVEPENIGTESLQVAAASAAPLVAERPAPRTPRVKRATTPRVAPELQFAPQEHTYVPRPVAADAGPVVLSIAGLHKRFGTNVAVDGISLDVHEGSFYGIVGPNGAGKTTTLSIVTGLLRPDSGTVSVHGVDVWEDAVKAKRSIGVLPDRLRLFDRLTGAQLLFYSGTLRGLDAKTVKQRSHDLAEAFGLEDAMGRLVVDYSAGMTKKVALAAAMIHSPRLLVLDEPFESVDPVSAANVIEILQKYVAAGGTVVLSSHGMDLIQRICDSVAIIVHGKVLDAGTVDEVRGEQTLEERFVELAGGRRTAEGMEWLHSFSD